MAPHAHRRSTPSLLGVDGHSGRSGVDRRARRGSRCSPGRRSTKASFPATSTSRCEWTAIILAVGVVQAICTGLRRYSAFRLAYRVETDLRMRLFAHLQRLHFAFHDQAQTGQLMAHANTDIQQIQQVVLLIPLTIASVLTMIAVVDHARVDESAARVVRARGVAVLEHRRDTLHAPHVSGRPRAAAGARRPVGRRRGERRRASAS